jgi:hypothetical protein
MEGAELCTGLPEICMGLTESHRAVHVKGKTPQGLVKKSYQVAVSPRKFTWCWERLAEGESPG